MKPDELREQVDHKITEVVLATTRPGRYGVVTATDILREVVDGLGITEGSMPEDYDHVMEWHRHEIVDAWFAHIRALRTLYDAAYSEERDDE